MLSVAVHKDIAEYQPKIVGKMTMRTLVSITGALSVSVLAGLYIYFVLGLNVSDCTYFIYAVSLPFWCVGFVKPCGMPFEQFAPLWLKANFTNDRIFYKPSMRLAGLLSESENSKQKGTRDNRSKHSQWLPLTSCPSCSSFLPWGSSVAAPLTVYKYSRLAYQQTGEPYTPYILHIKA